VNGRIRIVRQFREIVIHAGWQYRKTLSSRVCLSDIVCGVF
jgi:hypothetical protein